MIDNEPYPDNIFLVFEILTDGLVNRSQALSIDNIIEARLPAHDLGHMPNETNTPQQSQALSLINLFCVETEISIRESASRKDQGPRSAFAAAPYHI